MLFLVTFTQNLDLHAHLEKRERLCKVAYAKLISRVHLCVLHFKVEPLLVTLCVCVYFAVKVVPLNDWLLASLAHFNVLLAQLLCLNFVEVATLEISIELE